MGFARKAVVFLMMIMAALQFSTMASAEVYKVGDSAGWTTGFVDYNSWAASKTFHIGDSLVFQYYPQFHNVMEVSNGDYTSCNVTTPLATYSTGNDSITIKSYGHHFFVCGAPGHCNIGQKVDINVVRSSSGAMAPAPSQLINSASLPSIELLAKMAMGFVIFVGFLAF